MKAPEDLSKEQLIRDLIKLRERISELEQLKEVKGKSQVELGQTKAMFEGLFEFSPDAVIVVNRNGIIARVNKQAEILFGYSKEELVDREIEILLPDRFKEKHVGFRREFASNPHIRLMGTGLQLYGEKKDGSEFSADIALGPLKAQEDMFVITVIRDVTRLKKAEEALRMSEYASSAAEIGTWHWDMVNNELIWNDKCKELFGYPSDYLITYDAFLGPIHVEDRPGVDEAVRKALQDKKEYFGEMRVVLPDGQLRWVMAKGRGFYDDRGKPLRMHGIAMDITERKSREEDLLESQRHAEEQSAELKALIELLPAGVWIFNDPGCSMITGNRVAREILGPDAGQELAQGEPNSKRPRVEIRKDGVSISPDQLLMHTACTTGRPIMGEEIDIVLADGVIRNLYGNAVPLFDGRGAVRGSVGVLLDVTELRQAKEEIFRLASIVESSSDAIISKSLAGIITTWNHGAEVLYGYTAGEIIGRSISLLVPADRLDDTLAILNKIRGGETLGHYETVRRRKDGSFVEVSLALSPITDSAGRIIGAGTIARDITQRKRIEERLYQYSKEIERSNKELDQFASIVAHDLQAPLRVALGFADRLQKQYKDKLDANAQKYILHIIDGTKRMRQLISDLLEYSRAGTRVKPFVSVDCNHVLKDVLANLMFEIKESSAVITADHLPTIIADGAQLTQLFQNLIGNAVKYRSSEPPLVHIAAERKVKEWLFQVNDNGIGLDPRHSKDIFEIFRRLHTREEYSGTGIGLAICKKIVERHGGHIWVESRLGEGATFFFNLPATDVH